MELHTLSLFPSFFSSPLESGIIQRAIQKGYLSFKAHDLREFGEGKWKRVDSPPFGGGPGMLLSPEPIAKGIEKISSQFSGPSLTVALVAGGAPLTPQLAAHLATYSQLLFVAGHYEGIDQRVIQQKVDLELSIGDFILTNGALAALVAIDADVAAKIAE